MLIRIDKILEKAGETVGKAQYSDKYAQSKAIVKGLVQSFNKGRAQARVTTITPDDADIDPNYYGGSS